MVSAMSIRHLLLALLPCTTVLADSWRVDGFNPVKKLAEAKRLPVRRHLERRQDTEKYQYLNEKTESMPPNLDSLRFVR